MSGNRYGPYIRAAGPKDSPPEPDELKASASNASKYPRLEFISASALSSIPPREFYLGKQYRRSVVSVTMAPAGRGKSSLDLVEAVSMAIGRDLLSEEPPRRLKVWYHNGEENWDEFGVVPTETVAG